MPSFLIIMKTSRFVTLLTFATAMGAAPLLAQNNAVAKEDKYARITIVYENSLEFTDFKDSYHSNERMVAGLEEEFNRYLKRTAAGILPEGQSLTITFTDIDMAGDFEPWRGLDAHDIRIIKPIYPPRIKFTYTVTDAGGAVVQEGEERLSDLSFQITLGINRNDVFFYEQELMRSWMRKLRG